jgi:hypothetical protein
MPSNDYHFITRWRLVGTREEAADVVSDALGLPRWWPAVYLEVRELQPGEPSGVGRVLDLYTKGWLPYTLRWHFTVTESDYPRTLAIAAEGDFVGRGRWTFEQDGPWVDVTYDWRIRAQKPLLRRMSWLMKPVFSANHRWAMAKGRESLELELARRRAGSEEQRRAIPAPPRPTSPGRQFIAAGLGLAVLGIAAATFAAVRSR